MYRYIGNKTKLLNYIVSHIRETIGLNGIVCDLMAGTGSVSLELKKNGYTLVSSDMMTYSYHHLNVHLMLDNYPSFSKLGDFISLTTNNFRNYLNVLEYLNNIKPIEGYFFNEFSPDGIPASDNPARKYFTSKNACRIDAIRDTINHWIDLNILSKYEESLLKHNLIMAVNHVANISGTYGYFLSDFKKNSLSELQLLPVDLYLNNTSGHKVLQGFAEDISTNIYSDLCYIDPPYKKRQYAANYHILETLARGDSPEAIGKSGLRDWWENHSKFCTTTRGLDSFDKIFSSIHCNKFIVSYSEDGLFTLNQLKESFKKFGDVKVFSIDFNRFRSNDSKLPKKLKEYLIHIYR